MFLFCSSAPCATPASVPPVPTAQMKPSTLPSVCCPDFRTGGLDMALAVGDIVELVGPDRAVRLGLGAAARPAGRRASHNCSDWNRAPPAPRPARRRRAAACPSFPGSGFPGSRSRSGSRAHWRPARGRCRYCRRSPRRSCPPGLSSPRFTASSNDPAPARSLTDWPGFMNSALPRMVQPVASDACFSLISGVLPIASTTLSGELILAYPYKICRLYRSDRAGLSRPMPLFATQPKTTSKNHVSRQA